MRQGTVVDLDRSLAIEAAEVGASLSLHLADSTVCATTLAIRPRFGRGTLTSSASSMSSTARGAARADRELPPRGVPGR